MRALVPMSCFGPAVGRLLPSVFASLVLVATQAVAATVLMNQPTVACPNGSNWSNTACWQGGVVPVTGDDVVIQSPAANSTNYDLGSGVRLNSITLTSASGNVTISGGPIALKSGGVATDNFNNGGQDVFPGFTLNGPATFTRWQPRAPAWSWEAMYSSSRTREARSARP